MSGFFLKIDLEGGEAGARLAQIVARMDRRRPLHEGIGAILMRRQQESFRHERTPEGVPWTPLRPKTIAERKRKRKLPLTILRSNSVGRAGSSLAGSVSYDADEERVVIGSESPYGAIHQFGGTIDIPAQTRRTRAAAKGPGRRFARAEEADGSVAIPAHRITIPARPYIGVAPEDRDAIAASAEDWLIR